MLLPPAAAIRRRATSRPNPKAEEIGCGPCLIAAGRYNQDRGRPLHELKGRIGANGAIKRFYAMAYHVTWCDANNQPPPAQVGLVYSHLCNEGRCVEPKHGIWEESTVNVANTLNTARWFQKISTIHKATGHALLQPDYAGRANKLMGITTTHETIPSRREKHGVGSSRPPIPLFCNPLHPATTGTKGSPSPTSSERIQGGGINSCLRQLIQYDHPNLVIST
jgi:hypothetical protein